MRVLFFSGSEIDAIGGMEGVLVGLAEELARSNHSIGILELAAKTSDGTLQAGIARWTCPPIAAPVLTRVRSWRDFVARLRRVRAVIRDFAPDIVWVHFPCWQAIPLAVLTVLPRGWRLVVTAHGSDIRSMPFTQPQLRPWLRRLFKEADLVTAVSRYLLQELLEQHPYAKDKSHVVHNSIETSWLDARPVRTAANRGYVLFVGRLHPIKGLDILLRAWKSIQPSTAELDLLIVGDGPERERLAALAESLGVTSAVRFVGMRSQAELSGLYGNARVVVIPSRNEGLPLVALEAGACGAIVVASAVGGLPEVIEHGVNGFLVEPESPDALGKSIVRALELSEAERQRMSGALRSTVERSFIRSRIARQYEALFESLMGGRDAGPHADARGSTSTRLLV